MEPQAECMLVLIGVTPEGKKELLGFQVGMRESTQSWRERASSDGAESCPVSPPLRYGMATTMGQGGAPSATGQGQWTRACPARILGPVREPGRARPRGRRCALMPEQRNIPLDAAAPGRHRRS
jgi:hypothetical protein